MHAAHSQAILVAIRKDAHIAANLVLEANSQAKPLGSLLRVEVFVIVCTHSNDREIELAAIHHLVDGRNVNAERTTLIVLRLVTL